MQIHQLGSNNKRQKGMRVGRGGKRGTYSGRGVKGQKSRAGRKIRPQWRDLIKQIPKRRGYKFKPVSDKGAVLNLNDVISRFSEGEIISPSSLIDKGIIGKIKGREPMVKILGEGEVTKKLSFAGLTMSKSAKEKVKKAGGTVK